MRAGNAGSGGCPVGRNLRLRILTGGVFAFTFLAAAWLGGLVFRLYILLVGLALVWEYARLTRLPPSLMGLLWLSLPVVVFRGEHLQQLSGSAALAWVLPLGAMVYLGERVRRPLPWSAFAFWTLAYLYLFPPVVWVVQVRGQGWGVFLAFFLILWASDTGAYAVGKTIGRHPLAPTISPSKTWEGFLGGVVASVLVALWVSRWVFLPRAGWLGAAVAVSGEVGDLLESALKRDAGVKDSSRLLPGHGGVLDRLDSLLLALPVYWIWMNVMGSG